MTRGYILIIAILVSIRTSDSSGPGFGGLCLDTMPCEAMFVCQQYAGCKWGRCVCKPRTVYNFTTHKCIEKSPPPPAKHGEMCRGEHAEICTPGLVCLHCDFDAISSVALCRKESKPMAGYGTGNGTYDDICESQADCGVTLTCQKSDDCTYGSCKCGDGFVYSGAEGSCIAASPVVRLSVGEPCSTSDLTRICVNSSICSMCPSMTSFTCIGNHMTYKTVDVTPTLKPVTGQIAVSPAVYVVIPIGLVLIAGLVLFIVRKRSRSQRGLDFTTLETEPSFESQYSIN